MIVTVQDSKDFLAKDFHLHFQSSCSGMAVLAKGSDSQPVDLEKVANG